MKARPGEMLVSIRKSHAWHWRPHAYRHISGGLGCHWLGVFVLVHNVTMDRAAAEYLSKQAMSRRRFEAVFNDICERPDCADMIVHPASLPHDSDKVACTEEHYRF